MDQRTGLLAYFHRFRFLFKTHLGLHLICLVLIKALVLFVLWRWLIQPYQVSVQVDEMSKHLTESVPHAQEN
jgi:hypothetical protein